MEINDEQAGLAVEKLEKSMGSLSGRKIAILGITFKPDTDDLRESPALRIIDKLLSMGATIVATDPQGLPGAEKIYGKRIAYSADCKTALDGADAAILVTKWKQFAGLSPEEFKRLLKKPHRLVDCRGFYSSDVYSKKLEYYKLGLKREP
jgi:UDPglucose 6-dehydrogenase